MSKNTVEIIINEAKGTRLWKWNSRMSAEEFSDWWTNMRDRDFIKIYFNIKSLEGKLTPYTSPNTEKTDMQRMSGDPSNYRPFYYMYFNEMEDSFIAISEDKVFYSPTSRRDWKEFWPEWIMKRSQKPRNGYMNAQ